MDEQQAQARAALLTAIEKKSRLAEEYHGFADTELANLARAYRDVVGGGSPTR